MVFCEGNQLFAGDFNAVLDDWIIKILKQQAIPNSCLQKVKDLLSEGCRKTIQRWIMSSSKVSNLNGRYHFRLWVFASSNEYFYCWHWRVLHKVLQGK